MIIIPGRNTRRYVGLLDSIPDLYSSTVFAISVRKLTYRYNGPCMLVRENIDSTTLDIPFCKTDNTICRTTIANFCSGTTGFIRTWYDQSSVGDNAEQGVAGSQPTIFASGDLQRWNTNNWSPYALFNSKLLTFSATSCPSGMGGCTMGAVWSPRFTSGVRGPLGYGTNANGQYRGINTTNNTIPRASVGSYLASTTTVASNNYVSTIGRFNSSLIRVRNFYNSSNALETANSSSVGSYNTTSNQGVVGNYVLGATQATEYISEAFIINRELTNEECAILEKNIVDYYGIIR